MKTLLGILLITISYNGLCQQVSKEEHVMAVDGFRLDFEQDVLMEVLQLNSDRNYTQGLGIGIYSSRFTAFLNDKVFAKNICVTDTIVRFYQPADFSIHIAGFTPDNLRDSLPIIGDRPYSSVLWASLRLSVLNATAMQYKQHGFYIGVLGIDGPAEDAQTAIHKSSNNNDTQPPYNPKGWHNQISNGGEPTLMYTHKVSKLITQKRLREEISNGKNPKRLKLLSTWSYGFSAGYITEVNAGMNVKFGKLDLSNWHSDLFNQMGFIAKRGGDILTPEQIKEYYQKEKDWELYLFSSVTPSLTVYNGSLHGQFRRTNYRLPYNETGFLNAHGRVGLAWTSEFHSLAVYTAFKSPEMWNEYSRVHSWGGASLIVKWN